MRKRTLLRMPILTASKEMMALAADDIPETVTLWGGASYLKYKRSCYLRSSVRHGILTTAFYDPAAMRNGDDKPFMALFIDRKEGRYLTYDYRGQKWIEAMLENIDWPQRYYSVSWCASEDEKRIRRYLHRETDYGSAKAILLSYQKSIREAALDAKYRRESELWRAEN